MALKQNNKRMILGIDIGGTTVKFGVVNDLGEIAHHNAFDTTEWAKNEGFIASLKIKIKQYIALVPEIKGVGIGFPGLLSKDRTKVIQLPNIPSVENAPVYEELKAEFPTLTIKLENDAKCAALGELYFSGHENLDDFMMITLGTGVGSALVINKRLFLGANGNAMEMGHMLSTEDKTLEEHLGLQRISDYAAARIREEKITTVLDVNTITPKAICEAAENGDKFSREVYDFVGERLGEALVSAIRILDVTTVVLAGGVAGAFKFFENKMNEVLHHKLPEYYLKDLVVTQSKITQNAGLLGAAALIKQDFDVSKSILG